MNPGYGRAVERARTVDAKPDTEVNHGFQRWRSMRPMPLARDDDRPNLVLLSSESGSQHDEDAHRVTINGKHVLIRETQAGRAKHGTQSLSKKSEDDIWKSNLTSEQAIAFEDAVLAAGQKYGIDPNILVGMAVKESSLKPTSKAELGSAAGLMGLTDRVQEAYGLTNEVAKGSSPTAITSQVYVAANYLRDLMHDPVPSGHPSHQLEIALGYYRGNRRGVNEAVASKGGTMRC